MARTTSPRQRPSAVDSPAISAGNTGLISIWTSDRIISSARNSIPERLMFSLMLFCARQLGREPIFQSQLTIERSKRCARNGEASFALTMVLRVERVNGFWSESLIAASCPSLRRSLKQ